MRKGPDRGVDVVGLIPAAGLAVRMAPSPCSKEVFPVGLRRDAKSGTLRPKVVSHYLLEKMRLAGVMRAYFVLRDGKWDIPSYFGDGSMLDMSLGYLMMGRPSGPPYTIDQAYPFVQDALVAFGFPDILFTADDIFVRVMDRQQRTKADVVVGLLPAESPENVDMVDVDEHGRVHELVIKPRQTTLRYTWLVAVWTPAFTTFLHAHLIALTDAGERSSGLPQPELTMGEVLQAAMSNGLRVDGVVVPDATYNDIGTPEGLSRLLTAAGGIGPSVSGNSTLLAP